MLGPERAEQGQDGRDEHSRSDHVDEAQIAKAEKPAVLKQLEPVDDGDVLRIDASASREEGDYDLGDHHQDRYEGGDGADAVKAVPGLRANVAVPHRFCGHALSSTFSSNTLSWFDAGEEVQLPGRLQQGGEIARRASGSLRRYVQANFQGHGLRSSLGGILGSG